MPVSRRAVRGSQKPTAVAQPKTTSHVSGQAALDYLMRFFASHYDDYFAEMNESARGYTPFYRDSQVIQGLRNIVHNIAEGFLDLRSPEKYPSPRAALEHVKSFDAYLNRQRAMIRKASKHYIDQEEPVPGPTDWLYRMNRDVSEAIRHALTLTDEPTVHASPSANPALSIISRILARFNVVARQLRERRKDGEEARETLRVRDEYDVQDLLHGLFKIDFDDVRREEPTPSSGIGSARMDMLLVESGIVVECKMTRRGLTSKKLSDELILDVARYATHPNCKNLVFFIFDPKHVITNPKALAASVENSPSQFPVHVVICPNRSRS
jgi:hypothetical protein